MNRHLVAAKLFLILGAVMLSEIGLAPGSLLAQEANQQQQALAANTFVHTAAAAAPAPPEEKGLASLKHSRISPYELKIAGGGDPAKAPEALVAVLGDSRLKHLSYVTAVTYSPSGKLLASAGGDGAVRLWNPDTGEEQGRLMGRPLWEHGPANLNCLGFSPDGRTIAAGGLNNAVILWDVATGRELQVLRADVPVYDLAFSPDGRLLASGHELDAQLWDLSASKLRHRLTAHAKDFRREFSTDHVTVAFTLDGQTLFVGHPDGMVRTWEAKTGKLVKTLPAHDTAVQSLALSKDGKFLATGSRDKTARLWEPTSGRLLHTLQAHEHYVQAVAFHPKDKTLATAGLDGKVKYWDVNTGNLQLAFTASRNVGVECLSFSADGGNLATAGLAVRIWDAKTGQPRVTSAGHVGATNSLAFSPDSRTLVTGGADGTVKLWDPVAQSVRQSLDLTTTGIQAVAISPDGRTIATLDWGKPTVQLWDLATGRKSQTYQPGGDLGEALAFSPDGRWLAARMFDKSGCAATIWDLHKGALHGRVSTGPFSRGSLLFSSDSKKVIIAGHRNHPSSKSHLNIWDLATLRVDTQLEEPAGLADLHAAALSPDGRTLALSGTLYAADQSGIQVVLLWDMAKQQPRLVLDHGKSYVHYMDFAPDGCSLVTLGWLTSARVWDPRDGKLRETIRLCEPGPYHINAARFAPDSRHFAAAMGNGTVYILRIQPPAQDVKEVVMAPGSLGKGPLPPTELWKQLLGKPAPELQQIKGWVYGKPTRLADLRGTHVLLHFWNMESESDMATLMLLQRMFGDKSFHILVIGADYGGTAEGMRKALAERDQYRWGGGELPFPFAMDGGGETPIAGTGLKTYGATHAAYGIVEGHRGRRTFAGRPC